MIKLSNLTRNQVGVNTLSNFPKITRSFRNNMPYSPYGMQYKVFHNKSVVFNEMWKMGFDYTLLNNFWTGSLRSIKRILAFQFITGFGSHSLQTYYNKEIPLFEEDAFENVKFIENANISHLQNTAMINQDIAKLDKADPTGPDWKLVEVKNLGIEKRRHIKEYHLVKYLLDIYEEVEVSPLQFLEMILDMIQQYVILKTYNNWP